VFLGVFGGADKVYPILEPILLNGDKVCMHAFILQTMQDVHAVDSNPAPLTDHESLCLPNSCAGGRKVRADHTGELHLRRDSRAIAGQTGPPTAQLQAKFAAAPNWKSVPRANQSTTAARSSESCMLACAENSQGEPWLGQAS